MQMMSAIPIMAFTIATAATMGEPSWIIAIPASIQQVNIYKVCKGPDVLCACSCAFSTGCECGMVGLGLLVRGSIVTGGLD